jgi:hypothetical protein
MVEARAESVKTINHTQLLQITIAIAAVSSTFFSGVHGGHSTHAHKPHNHWKMIDIEQNPHNWPPPCHGELVDEGITHAHALLRASRIMTTENAGLREWITEDANTYDPDLLHVNTRAEIEFPAFNIFESHFFTCYSIVYDEDGDHMGYDS